jgi:hypothetical protein
MRNPRLRNRFETSVIADRRVPRTMTMHFIHADSMKRSDPAQLRANRLPVGVGLFAFSAAEAVRRRSQRP